MTQVIGSQSNVPDIGDPITSPWAQDTAKKIVHVFATTTARDAWTSPPNGAVCQAPAGAWYTRIGGVWVPLNPTVARGDFDTDIGSHTTGVFDIAFVTLAAFAYPVSVQAVAMFQFGFGSANNNIACDVVRSVDAAARSLPGLAVSAGAYQAASIAWGWNVNAGADPSFKTRATIQQAGNSYLRSFGTYTVTRRDP